MPIETATPARIRRSVREFEYARVSNSAILIQNPDAVDGYQNVRRTFFDDVDDAQVLLTELSNVIMAHRIHVGVESEVPMGIGTTIAVTPVLPRARVVDRSSDLDKTCMIKGVAIDLHTGRNSVEVVG